MYSEITDDGFFLKRVSSPFDKINEKGFTFIVTTYGFLQCIFWSLFHLYIRNIYLWHLQSLIIVETYYAIRCVIFKNHLMSVSQIGEGFHANWNKTVACRSCMWLNTSFVSTTMIHKPLTLSPWLLRPCRKKVFNLYALSISIKWYVVLSINWQEIVNSKTAFGLLGFQMN